MHFGGLVRKLVLRCRGHKKLHCCVHNYQNVILTVRRWRIWVYCMVWNAAVFAEPVSRLILMDERVVGRWGYSNAIYMVPKIALVTDDGLISVFNRSLAGATGIGRGGQLAVGQGSDGRHLIEKLNHRAGGVRGSIYIWVVV